MLSSNRYFLQGFLSVQLLRFYGELRALEWRNTEVMQKMRRQLIVLLGQSLNTNFDQYD
jgi:hypothetical protein